MQSLFGHFLVNEFFNSHACLQQLRVVDWVNCLAT